MRFAIRYLLGLFIRKMRKKQIKERFGISAARAGNCVENLNMRNQKWAAKKRLPFLFSFFFFKAISIESEIEFAPGEPWHRQNPIEKQFSLKKKTGTLQSRTALMWPVFFGFCWNFLGMLMMLMTMATIMITAEAFEVVAIPSLLVNATSPKIIQSKIGGHWCCAVVDQK